MGPRDTTEDYMHAHKRMIELVPGQKEEYFKCWDEPVVIPGDIRLVQVNVFSHMCLPIGAGWS